MLFHLKMTHLSLTLLPPDLLLPANQLFQVKHIKQHWHSLQLLSKKKQTTFCKENLGKRTLQKEINKVMNKATMSVNWEKKKQFDSFSNFYFRDSSRPLILKTSERLESSIKQWF